MSSAIKCHVCGSEEIDHDPARGDAACVDCGAVVQQSLIVNDVAFQEDGRGRSNLIGQHVRADGVFPGHSRHATEHTMTHARHKMLQIASQLRLATRHSDQALRLFRLAVEQNFHKGRRVINLASACLYVVCRLEKTPHMLLDFSDVVQTNVYSLGYTYLKLVRLLNLQLPVIDPSLYMHRFAAKLEYGEKQNAVAMTALRIAARMQRDWMTQGRRPSGLCGAALITASIMHGFSRSQKEVARVVRIGCVALRTRLRELDQTSTAKLTGAQIDAGGGDDGNFKSLTNVGPQSEVCDPPAFTRLQERNAQEAAAKKAVKEKEKEGEKEKTSEANGEDGAEDAEAATVEGGKVAKRKENVNDEERARQAAEEDRIDTLMADAMSSREMQALDHESNVEKDVDAQAAQANAGGTKKRRREGSDAGEGEDVSNEGDGEGSGDDENEDLSDLDDEDAAKYISTEAEFKAKEVVWTETNKEYLEQQERLERLKRENPEEYRKLRPGRSQKKRKTSEEGEGSTATGRKETGGDGTETTTTGTTVGGNDMEEVAKKPSKKLNYSVLEQLNEEDESDEDGEEEEVDMGVA